MKNIIFFILLPVFLTTTGEFILKFSINEVSQTKQILHIEAENGETEETTVSQMDIVTEPPVQNGFINLKATLSSFLMNPAIIGAALMITIGGILWLVAMSKFELSFIYPFLSINYVVIVLGSQLILNEKVSLFRYLSVILIVIGLIFISRSPYSETSEERKRHDHIR